MLSRLASSSTLRQAAAARATNTGTFAIAPPRARLRSSFFSRTVRDATSSASTVDDALQFSGYSAIDFTIPEDAPTYDAVQKFSAFNIGCLVTTDQAGNMTGVVSERDYICKIALLGRTSRETPVRQIATVGAANIVTATADESVQVCMEKMMNHGVRHLPIVDADTRKVVGMVSIKDLVKTVVKEKEDAIRTLSNFALGKGGHFGTE